MLEEEQERRQLLPHLHGYPLYKWQREFMNSSEKILLLTCANQVGKALPLDTLIPTPHGFKAMRDLKVGDHVLSWWGNPVKILGIPFEGEEMVYKITFNDGTSIEASENHDWFCKGYQERFRNKDEEWVVKDTKTIQHLGGYNPDTTAPKRFTIPVADSLNLPGKALFDPYMMGLLLGDGCVTTRNISMTSADDEIISYLKQNYVVKKSGRFGFRIKAENGIADILEKQGLLGSDCFTKFIPEEYFWGSKHQRMELLRGLMDTDGTVDQKGICFFSSASRQLAEDVRRLVNTLGGLSFLTERQGAYTKNGQRFKTSKQYLLRISIPECPFRLSRKKSRFKFQKRNAHERVIYKIEPVGIKPVKCITVTGEGSFLAGKECIVTHNSSIQIKKMIHWATEPSLWERLWPSTPITFWYLYPSLKVFDKEIKLKWIPEFLPRGKYKDHPLYGWKAEKAPNGLIESIRFNSGVTIIGKSYMSEPETLQTGTVWYLAYDEEMPEELWPELQMRVDAAMVNGYISGVFTPTLSQQFWYDVMEERGTKELLPDAHKITASLYDCQVDEFGVPTMWTNERINKRKNSLPSNDEVLRRVYGRFIMDKEVLKYPSFSKSKNLVESKEVPANWLWYAGIDSGSGGTGKRHPAAITFVAVSPDFKKGRVVEVWRGTPENVEGDDKNTTADDILKQYVRMKGKRQVVAAYYDYNDADMGTIAEREGIAIIRAEKRHEIGVPLLNTLFKNQILNIDDVEENHDLVDELIKLRKETAKNKAKDDAADSLRYAVALIPWDLDNITGATEIVVAKKEVTYQDMVNDRRLSFAKDTDKHNIDQEIEELNDLYEA